MQAIQLKYCLNNRRFDDCEPQLRASPVLADSSLSDLAHLDAGWSTSGSGISMPHFLLHDSGAYILLSDDPMEVVSFSTKDNLFIGKVVS